MPPKKPTRQVISMPLMPMAAEAAESIRFPAKIRSTVLYNCCTRNESSSGRAKTDSFFQMLPVVRSR